MTANYGVNFGSGWAGCFSSFGNYGSKSFGAETLPSLDFSGMVNMSGTTVLGRVNVQGMLTLNNSSLQSVDAQGSMQATHSTFGQGVTFSGSLKSISSVFLGTITATTKEIILDASQTRDIVLHPTVAEAGLTEQRVVLENGSNVMGNITFEGGNGRVIVRSGSTISGAIVGGVRYNS